MSKDQVKRNEALHDGHVLRWSRDKKREETWLSKEDYQKKTGKPGKS